MQQKNNNKQKPLVLLAPLDWGLGHTTRCIPIIKTLQEKENTVIIACNSTQKVVLQEEFPEISFYDLPGYNIRYGKNAGHTIKRLIYQLPKIIKKIREERRWLRSFLAKTPVDLVISDNRYGFNSPRVPCIFISHQLSPKSGAGRPADWFFQRMITRLINQFNECWVPDNKSHPSLSGELSASGKSLSIKIKHIGILSRFSPIPDQRTGNDRILVLISGPEPQRTIFENLLIRQAENSSRSFVFVRGLPGNPDKISDTNNVKFYNHLPAALLARELQEAAFVICRAGYTSIMDLAILQKKMILVPTPGQAEQEYLGDYLGNQGLAMVVAQKDFDLQQIESKIKNFHLEPIEIDTDLLQEIVEETMTGYALVRAKKDLRQDV